MAYELAIQALADPTRRLVLERLRRGPQPVGQLAEGMHVSRPAVSQHLAVLERAGLVQARRQGTRRIYAVEVRGLQELRSYLDSFWGEVLEAFKAEAERPQPGRSRGRPGKAAPSRPIARRRKGKRN